jgi:lysophospholipase L1-like esterase
MVLCVAAVAALGAFVFAPAAGAGTIGSTYLALGDSLAYGFHLAQFREEFAAGVFSPTHMQEGYVDDFAATLKASNPSLQYINDGCPGETTDAFIRGSSFPIHGFCSDFPTGEPFPDGFLHHEYRGSQMGDALEILKATPNVSPITLDIGSNDLLKFLGETCGFPKENKCTEAQFQAEFEHIALNVGFILRELHAADPKAQMVLVGSYNPFPGFPTPGGDLALAALNGALEQVAAATPHTSFANTEPVFNPSLLTKGPESEDLPTICAFTAMCPGGVFNPATGDIHPTKLGYEVMAGVVSASFFDHVFQEFNNWVVSGTFRLKKLNQVITLPPGSTFNGEAAINLLTESGPLTGTFAVPPFEAAIKILGIPATVGVEVTQSGTVQGSIEKSKTVDGDVTLSAPTKANIGFTTINILGLTIPTKCQSVEPLQLSLVDDLTVTELLTTGSHFMGTTTFPTVKCEGSLGILEASVLNALFSGPSNPYSITISPPA